WRRIRLGPLLTPLAPSVAAEAGDGEVTLSWSAPTWTGGGAITGYEITASPDEGITGGATRATGAGDTSLVFDGLTNETTYTFIVVAESALGDGAAATVDATPFAPP